MNTLDYRRAAQQHRPSSWESLQREIRRLHTEQGLTPRDISLALSVGLGDVLDALREVTR